jgi:D-alanyl-D-alanine carboxypeptidase (penicillin-binding protein 5/6)
VGGPALLRRGLVVPAGAPSLPRNVTARAWIVTDLDTGAVLAARDPHGRYQPASIQKLLTTVTLLPRLAGNRAVVVSKAAASTEGSHAGLVAGGRYTVDDLFRGLLLVSGNDAAEALAEAAGGRRRTVDLMNAEARRLGAYDTFVETPSGLDGWRQLTSAYDMALVLRAALSQPRFLRYDTVARTHLPAQRRRHVGAIELDNQNELFLTRVNGALAAKTGFTDAAQHTFAGAIVRGGHRYGVVLMRAQRWPLDQWQQAARLVGWATGLPIETPPVGRLVTPVAGSTLTGATSAGATSAAEAAPPASASASSSAPDDERPTSTGAGLIVLAVIVGAALYLSSRLTRGRRRRGDPGTDAGDGSRPT